MHRRQTFRALTMASVLLAVPSYAQEADDPDVVPALKTTLPATPVNTAADPTLGETEDAAGSKPEPAEFVIPPLRASLPATDLRTVVRPVPPSLSAKLPAVAPSLPPVTREADARAEYEPLGLRLGSFVVNATTSTGLGVRHHSTEGNETFVRSTGEIDARSDWESNSLEMRLGGAYRRSLSGIDESLPEGDASIAGRFDLTNADRLTASAGWTLRDDTSGDGKENTFSGSLGYERFGGLVGLKTGIGIDRTVNETDPTLDNTALSSSLRLSLDRGAILKPFVEDGCLRARFRPAVAAGDGISRNGVGGEAKAGVSVARDDLTGEVALGYGYEWLDDSALADISGLIGSASLTWDASELLRLSGIASTSFAPTSAAGASGVLKRTGELTVTYALTPNAFVVTGGELTLEDYAGIDRQVATTTLKAGVGYKFNRTVELGLDGEHKIVRSDAAGGDYTDSSVTATLTLAPLRDRRSGDRPAALAPFRPEDAAEHQCQRQRVIGMEALAEHQHGEDRGEHRDEIDEHAGPPRPDQLDAAHEEDLRDHRGEDGTIGDHQPAEGRRRDILAHGDLDGEERQRSQEGGNRQPGEKGDAGNLRPARQTARCRGHRRRRRRASSGRRR